MQNTTTLGENQRNGLYPRSQAAFEEAVTAARMLPSMRPASLREVTQSEGWRRAVLCSLLPLLLAQTWVPQAPHTPQDHPHFPPVLALAAPGPRLPVGRTILIITPNMSWADTSVENSKKKWLKI